MIEKCDQKIRLVPPEISIVRPERALEIHRIIERQHFHQACQHERIHRRIRQIRVRSVLINAQSGVGLATVAGFLGSLWRCTRYRLNGRMNKRRVTVPIGYVPGELGRVHRFRRGEIPIRAEVVEKHQRNHAQRQRENAQIARTRADFQLVDQVLNEGR